MHKLLFDNQVFSWQTRGGISRYFTELIQVLDKNFSISLPIVYSDNIYIKHNNNFWSKVFFKKDFIGRNKIIDFINKRKMIEYINNSKFDIFHPTYFDDYFLEYINKPFVITIHDMIPENFPQYFQNNQQLIHRKKILAEKADKIIAISNSTKQQILVHYPNIPKEKIEVIYHGSNFKKINTNSNISLPHKFILYIGLRDGYKNFNRFFKAFSRIAQKNNLKLVCIGPKFNQNEISMIQQKCLQDYVFNLSPSDEQLKYIYSQALFFVFPSLEEGFGLPLLEAMESSCPILCSDIPCFREIAAKAALFFDAKNTESIEGKMIEILNDQNKLDSLKELGKIRVQSFSWEISGEKLSSTYKKILKCKRNF